MASSLRQPKHFIQRDINNPTLKRRREQFVEALYNYIDTEHDRRAVNPENALRPQQVPTFIDMAESLSGVDREGNEFERKDDTVRGLNGLSAVLATMGYGKTVIQVKMVDAIYRLTGKVPNVVIVTQDEELIDHFYKTFKKFTPHFFFGSEKDRKVGRLNQTYKDHNVPILITTPQSMPIRKDADIYFLDEGDLFTSENRVKTLSQLQNSLILPFSATIGFSQTQNLDALGFDRAFDRNFEDAYKEGAISRCKAFEFVMHRHLGDHYFKKRDDMELELGRMMKEGRKQYKKDAWDMALDHLEHWKDPDTGEYLRDMVGYSSHATVSEAHAFAKEVNDRLGPYNKDKNTIPAVAIDGTMPKRQIKKILSLHAQGKIKQVALVNMGIRGLDNPKAQYMQNVAGTSSITRAKQRFGRVSRLDYSNPDKIGYGFDYVPDYQIEYDLGHVEEGQKSHGFRRLPFNFKTVKDALAFSGYKAPVEEITEEELDNGFGMGRSSKKIQDLDAGFLDKSQNLAIVFPETSQAQDNILEILGKLPQWKRQSEYLLASDLVKIFKQDREVATLSEDLDAEVQEFYGLLQRSVHIKGKGYQIQPSYVPIKGAPFRRDNAYVFALEKKQDQAIRDSFVQYLKFKHGKFLTPSEISDSLHLTKDQEKQLKSKLGIWQKNMRRGDEKVVTTSLAGKKYQLTVKLQKRGETSNNHLCISEHSLLNLAHVLSLPSVDDASDYLSVFEVLESYPKGSEQRKYIKELYKSLEQWLEARDRGRYLRDKDHGLRYVFKRHARENRSILEPFQFAVQGVLGRTESIDMEFGSQSREMRYKYLWDPISKKKILCLRSDDIFDDLLLDKLRLNPDLEDRPSNHLV